ncbi:kinase-like domain-containing protein [Rhizophagus irregularis DAOM 181602=DAOM 197198]|uniref:Kinase-like domain-containing protein n=1 Tax=Rhizophagus irregularis (strain DAOM 181602 / DAOM 197198 / MUCL 43194) TaxID=747089 RepID=A0A2P4PXI5_RHIID|nr:kinase-like domain-containing protein [Rhizophagus irregularis DAOM 181602=DAOM 197198]POG70101.1 kinase-like domain-containing protein [Rhizophagus irregularis DAOM 181602=DAOM 197198]|eukprot:XP_025176967.1 kinase-like domain-containing protein [Rhizophagus irregularis DAOM 181602=DAOM 197198]
MSNSIINHENCYRPNDDKLWCKECVPRCIIEGWTSGNNGIDEFIKDTIYNAKYSDDYEDDNYPYIPLFLEWVPFDRFKDVKQIGEGGFAKVYSATWIDGKADYKRQNDKSWKKEEHKPIKVALKKLNDSQNISANYLNEIKTLWNIYSNDNHNYLKFYGITKDTKTGEFMMIIQLAVRGNLRSILSIHDLKNLHKLGYFHKDFHSGNILQNSAKNTINTCVSDFGLSGQSNKQKSDNKICGVLPYIAPEVLNGEPYTLSSDVYSFGVIMTELTSGKPPFYNRKHEISLVLEICNGIRPEFEKGTPEFYKKLAYRCMSAVPNQRPTANELYDILLFWHDASNADKEIPNISTSYEKIPDAIYTSRVFTFSNLPKPVNSSIITSYLEDEEDNKDCQF